VETGLSSDPAMLWPVPELASKTIVSFSDAHSVPKLGRELTVFDGEFSYSGLAGSLASQGVAYTVEFYPEEGKYHYSGHRKCGVRHSPEDTDQLGGRCPECGRPLTLGVLHRVHAVAGGREVSTAGPGGFVKSWEDRPPFIRLVPLQEIIAETLGQGPTTRRVLREYHRIVEELGGELKVLLESSQQDLYDLGGQRMAEAILRARVGEVQVDPGYDGAFGTVRIWPDE
jgi:PHP family Zn ribbon phosphoesterase